jgi:hypothetical protein
VPDLYTNVDAIAADIDGIDEAAFADYEDPDDPEEQEPGSPGMHLETEA